MIEPATLDALALAGAHNAGLGDLVRYAIERATGAERLRERARVVGMALPLRGDVDLRIWPRYALERMTHLLAAGARFQRIDLREDREAPLRILLLLEGWKTVSRSTLSRALDHRRTDERAVAHG